ncbi:MAG: hypothetical protein MHM6MM_002424 [Cercozoa sp. M6MM]
MILLDERTWGDAFLSISPYFWAYLGVFLSVAAAVGGAAWGILLTSPSLMGAAVKAPRIKNKNIISIIFCEACAIFGLIMAIIIYTRTSGASVLDPSDLLYEHKFQQQLRAGYASFFAGLVVGLSNFVCGYAVLCCFTPSLSFLSFVRICSVSIGVTGAGCALADAQEPSLFVKMLIVEIFGSALGLFGLIVSIILVANADFA